MAACPSVFVYLGTHAVIWAGDLTFGRFSPHQRRRFLQSRYSCMRTYAVSFRCGLCVRVRGPVCELKGRRGGGGLYHTLRRILTPRFGRPWRWGFATVGRCVACLGCIQTIATRHRRLRDWRFWDLEMTSPMPYTTYRMGCLA
ncbi:hypothetical protein F5Y05DRAFT_394737 [Hypoxylon sp. FL0543]|nr:hypothetical protein F5Y05DRAFT_394737 [Hypoxylon sp. FL0543]